MELAGMKKFLGALESAGIKEWYAQIDTGMMLYHNQNNYNYFDEANEQIINFSKNANTGVYAGLKEPFYIKASHIADAHELRMTCNYEQAKKFAEAYGIDMTDELKKILVEIEASNFGLNPVADDYTFRVLSESEIELLTPDEKKEYDKKLKAYQDYKRKTSPPITVR